MHRAISPTVSGTNWLVFLQYSCIAPIMEVGLAKHAASGLMKHLNGVVSCAAFTISSYVIGPSFSHSFLHCSMSHIPQMFFNKRVEPSAPPSLVKFNEKVSSLITGCSDLIPIKDQVPELRYAKRSPSAGTASTADPVSCPATAITSTPCRPLVRSAESDNGPILVPEKTKGAKRSLLNSIASSKAGSNERVRGSIS